MQFNGALQDVLGTYFPGVDITILDFFGISNYLVDWAEELGFTDVTGTCLNFGVRKQAFCKNRNEYLYWDVLHPTTRAHDLIGAKALADLLGSE